MPYRSRFDEHKPRVLELYHLGMNYAEIGRKVGFDPNTVKRYLLQQGYTSKNERHYHDWFKGELTQFQRSLLLGTLLGDASLELTATTSQRNARIQLAHGEGQLEYLNHKADALRPLISNPQPRRHVHKQNGGVYYLIKSRCHPVFNEFADLLLTRPDAECNHHVHKKRITQAVLDRVDDIALTYWWLDDGTNHFANEPKLCLGGMSDDDYRVVYSWLSTQYGSIYRYDHPTANARYLIWQSRDEGLVLKSRLLAHTPDCMKSKIERLCA